MATKSDSNVTQSSADTVASIRQEIAGALGVAESDPLVDDTYRDLAVQTKEWAEAARIEHNNEIINDALTKGRRVETPGHVGDHEFRQFTEFIPGPNMDLVNGVWDAYVRSGYVEVRGDEELVHTRYLDPNNIGASLGSVDSVIKDGIETITNVNENVPGSIGLKPGDTRDVPAPGTTSAGVKPSTWDPQPDGRYGSTTSTPQSGSPSSDGAASHESPERSHDGQGTPSREESSPAEPPPASPVGESNGDKTTQWTRYDAEGNVTARGTETTHSNGSVTVTTTEGAATGSITYASQEERAKAETQNPPGTVTTGDQTTVEVEEPETDESLQDDADTNENDDDYIANDGYSDTGPVPAATVGWGTSDTIESAGAGHAQMTYSGPLGTFVGNPVKYQDGNDSNVTGAPIDFGDSTDPNADAPPDPNDVSPPSTAPYDLVDPDAVSLTAESPSELHMAGGGDYGDPNDPNAHEDPMPANNPGDSSPYEHTMASTAMDAGFDSALNEPASQHLGQSDFGVGSAFDASTDPGQHALDDGGDDDLDGDGLPG